ncbi:hypothetical protein GGU11DRAFT_791649 [Lentinula aff. detonsa]|nr:hypothetical protein GGU11DRAFT_791649 [Lentinula aff. detonsa]
MLSSYDHVPEPVRTLLSIADGLCNHHNIRCFRNRLLPNLLTHIKCLRSQHLSLPRVTPISVLVEFDKLWQGELLSTPMDHKAAVVAQHVPAEIGEAVRSVVEDFVHHGRPRALFQNNPQNPQKLEWITPIPVQDSQIQISYKYAYKSQGSIKIGLGFWGPKLSLCSGPALNLRCNVMLKNGEAPYLYTIEPTTSRNMRL